MSFLIERLIALVVFVLAATTPPASAGGSSEQARTGQGPSTAGSSPRIRAVTSISPLADMVARVGGDRITISNFVPIDVDPHTFEPTFSSLRSISQAQVIFLNGDGLDRAAKQNLMALRGKRCQVIDLSQTIPATRKNKIDPHYWLDPQFARIYVASIGEALTKLDPAGAAYFDSNARRYAQQIEELDARYQALCARLPARCKNIILYHNSWTYLATRYGFNVVGIIEASGTGEPSARSLAMLIRRAREVGVRAIISEPGHGSRILRAVQDGAKIPLVLSMMEDSLKEPPCDTYLGMMETDLRRLSIDICKQ